MVEAAQGSGSEARRDGQRTGVDESDVADTPPEKRPRHGATERARA